MNISPTVVGMLDAERDRQDAKWGAGRDLGDLRWLRTLIEEVGEVAKDMEDGLDIQIELVQAGAVVIAWLEALERRR